MHAVEVDSFTAIRSPQRSQTMVGENTFDCGITLAFAFSSIDYRFEHTARSVEQHNHWKPFISEWNWRWQVPALVSSFPFRARQIAARRCRKPDQRNGEPGVSLHSHTPGQNLNDNIIVGNTISGNGKDTADAVTPGTTGINVFGYHRFPERALLIT